MGGAGSGSEHPQRVGKCRASRGTPAARRHAARVGAQHALRHPGIPIPPQPRGVPIPRLPLGSAEPRGGCRNPDPRRPAAPRGAERAAGQLPALGTAHPRGRKGRKGSAAPGPPQGPPSLQAQPRGPGGGAGPGRRSAGEGSALRAGCAPGAAAASAPAPATAAALPRFGPARGGGRVPPGECEGRRRAAGGGAARSPAGPAGVGGRDPRSFPLCCCCCTGATRGQGGRAVTGQPARLPASAAP